MEPAVFFTRGRQQGRGTVSGCVLWAGKKEESDRVRESVGWGSQHYKATVVSLLQQQEQRDVLAQMLQSEPSQKQPASLSSASFPGLPDGLPLALYILSSPNPLLFRKQASTAAAGRNLEEIRLHQLTWQGWERA